MIIIEVTESVAIAEIPHGGAYWRIDETGRLLEKSDGPDYSLVRVEGLAPADLSVGKKMAVISGHEGQLTYMCEVLGIMKKRGITDKIESLDMSVITDISFRYDGRSTVKLGGGDNLDYKIASFIEAVNHPQLGADYRGTFSFDKDLIIHAVPENNTPQGSGENG
jgi:hypothetical protein